MKNLTILSLFALLSLFLVPQESVAQERKLYGYVTDAGNEPLVGESIRVTVS